MMARRREDDSGITLVELLVAISLTTIVLAVVGTVFVGALRTLGVSNAKGDLTGLSEIAMETITGPLRAADYAPPGQSEYSSAVLEASYNAVTVRSERYDQPLADSLATSILAANATSKVGLYLQSTKMVSKQIRYAYVANAAPCGNKSGITETVTSPRYSPSGNTIFVWDAGVTPIVSRCVLRSTTAPSLTTPVYSIFTYYTDCVTTTEDSAPLADFSDIGGIGIYLKASDAKNNLIELKNRICLVNVKASP